MKTVSMIVVAGALAAASSAQAGIEFLDQSASGPANSDSAIGRLNAFNHDYLIAQTITAGMSGQLLRVEMGVNAYGSPLPLLVEIRDVTGGVPGATLLGSYSWNAGGPTSGGYLSFDLTSQGIFLTAGQQFAVVLSTQQDFTGFANAYTAQTHTGAYAGGLSLRQTPFSSWSPTNGNESMYFRTYMTPAPGAAAVLGLAGLAATRRRRSA